MLYPAFLPISGMSHLYESLLYPYIPNHIGRALSWKPHGSEDGIAVPWKEVTVHAITCDPRKCVYMMLDFDLVWPGVHERSSSGGATNGSAGRSNGDANGGSESESDSGSDDDADDCYNDEPAITEVWLVPRDDAEVEKIYQAMTDCQLLNPDVAADGENNMMRMGDGDDSMSEDEQDDGFGNGDTIDEEDAEEQMQQMNLNDERFADAD